MSDLLNNILVKPSQNKTTQPLPAVKLDLNTQTKIQPLNPKGRMLKSQLFGSPVEYVKDMGKDIVNIKNGAKGKANDHELGRMNDLAMKTGSLALATYLFVKNPLKLKKTMEFVGFGTFFAAMALWPKLAIQSPLKARTGVDIHQRYQDSYGRKKMFFQDPQYIPWDLVSKEELNKMGDRLNIPKDIKNRDEVIKQKAQKLAVQGNTLWMLTAGFATPLISALSCNLAERAILPLQEKMAIDKTQTMIKDPSKFAPDFKNNEGKKALKSFLENNANQPMTKDMAEQIARSMQLDCQLGMKDAVVKDLLANAAPVAKPINDGFVQTLFSQNSKIFVNNQVKLEDLQAYIKTQGENFTINKENINLFIDNFTEFLIKNKKKSELEKQVGSIMENLSKTEGATAQLLKNGVVDKDAIKALVDNNQKIFKENNISCNSLINYVKNMIKEEQVLDFTINKENLSEFFAKNQSVNVNEKLVLQSQIGEKLSKLVERHNLPKVESISEIAEKMFGKIDEMASQKKVIDKFIKVRVGDEAETFIANQWGRVNKEFIKAIGITNKDLRIARDGGAATSKLIADKLAALAKDEDKYAKAMEKVAKEIAKYDDVLSEKFDSDLNSAIDELMDENRKKFAETNFENLKALINEDKAGSLKHGLKLATADRVLGARASFYRMIQTMDLFKRIENNAKTSPLDVLKEIDFAAVSSKKDITSRDLLRLLKGEFVDLGEDGYKNLKAKIEKSFGFEYNADEALNEYDTLLNKVHPGKAAWLRGQIKVLSKEDMTALVKKEMGDVGNPGLEKEIIEKWRCYAGDSINCRKSLISALEMLSNSSVMDMKMSPEVINSLKDELKTAIKTNLDDLAKQGLLDKAKKTLLEYKITDHTEKLNDIGPKAYAAVMKMLFRSDFDPSTDGVINYVSESSISKSLSKNIENYKNDFIDKIANWEYWYKKAHKLDGTTGSLDGLKRHLLVASTNVDMVKQTASSLYNTNKWLKMFGGGFMGLVGVTLVSELFLGKMKKEDVYAGDKK